MSKLSFLTLSGSVSAAVRAVTLVAVHVRESSTVETRKEAEPEILHSHRGFVFA